MKNRLMSAIGFVLLALICAAPVSHAQENQVAPEEEWNRLSREQKEILRERYQAFKKTDTGAAAGNPKPAGAVAKDGPAGQGENSSRLWRIPAAYAGTAPSFGKKLQAL